MKKYLSFSNSFEILFFLICFAALIAVVETFVIGQHYLIPSLLLVVAVLCGNLAWYGFHNRSWAKSLLFWLNLIFTCHCFFALFWSNKYRELLGGAFEPVCVVVIVVQILLLGLYCKRNQLLRLKGS